MYSMLRRKSKVGNPLSPNGILDNTNNDNKSLPTHSADSSSLSLSSPKQHSRSRIRMLKTGQPLQQILLDRKFWIRVLLFSLFFWKRYALGRQSHRYLVNYLAWKADTLEGSLWRGTLPSYQWKTADLQNVGVDIVVSHCDLPLDWIFQKWAKPITFDKVTVISKCGKPVEGAPPNANIITLPNLGRCDQSYAHYLLNHYDDYADYDDGDHSDQKDKFIVFTKDNDNMNRDVVSRHRSLVEMVAIAQSMGFACQEEQSWVFSPDHYFKICQPSAYMNWTAMAPYSRDSYVRLNRDDNSDFGSLNGKTLQEYTTNLNIPVPEQESSSDIVAPLCYGGNFLFNAKNIRQHPKELWERLEKFLSRGNNIAEGHYAERLWAHLLSPPLPKEKVQEILKQQDSTCRIEKERAGEITK
mmetsp:Transcript_29867/g.71780  ORF Transcript_29867/g.71780 Transcript_29867/m.71780 type:complete len:412 (+) Transcript_29867:74-1309(+)